MVEFITFDVKETVCNKVNFKAISFEIPIQKSLPPEIFFFISEDKFLVG